MSTPAPSRNRFTGTDSPDNSDATPSATITPPAYKQPIYPDSYNLGALGIVNISVFWSVFLFFLFVLLGCGYLLYRRRSLAAASLKDQDEERMTHSKNTAGWFGELKKDIESDPKIYTNKNQDETQKKSRKKKSKRERSKVDKKKTLKKEYPIESMEVMDVPDAIEINEQELFKTIPRNPKHETMDELTLFETLQAIDVNDRPSSILMEMKKDGSQYPRKEKSKKKTNLNRQININEGSSSEDEELHRIVKRKPIQ